MRTPRVAAVSSTAAAEHGQAVAMAASAAMALAITTWISWPGGTRATRRETPTWASSAPQAASRDGIAVAASGGAAGADKKNPTGARIAAGFPLDVVRKVYSASSQH